MPIDHTAQKLKYLDRQIKALELRKAGLTYQQIADNAGFGTRQAAFAAVQKALSKVQHEAAAPLLTLELERLDAMLLALWPQAKAGNQGAIDRVLRIMERRSKYLGLDAPTQTIVDQVTEVLVRFEGADSEAD